jgi:Beta protein
MFDHSHYVPILKAKQGELNALAELAVDVRDNLTPVIELPPIQWDFVDEAEAKSIDQHIEKLPRRLADSWHTDRPVFLDIPWWESEDALMANGLHPLEELGLRCAAANVKIIPVTGLGRPAAYQDAAHAVAQRHDRGLCIRIQPESFDALLEDPSHVLDDLRRSVPFRSTDLIVDMGEITEGQLPTVRFGTTTILRSIPHASSWRTLTLASSAFPRNLANFSFGVGSTPRADYQLWQIVRNSPTIPRQPTFGDYAIQAPEIEDIDPRVIRMSASLRYTSDDVWVIAKGRNVKTHTTEEFRRICQEFVNRPEYSGRHFSAGDSYIFGCAAGTQSAGNATVWRRIGTNHHLTFVVKQMGVGSGANAASV